MAQSDIQKIYDHYKKIQKFESIGSVLYWDLETMMPKGSADLRADQLALLGSTIHNLNTDPEYVSQVLETEIKTLENPQDQKHIKKLQKKILSSLCLDSAFVEKSITLTTKCHEKWKVAREQKSFGAVKKDLGELIKNRQELAQRLKESQELKSFYGDKNLYEVLLDEYEPGISSQYLRQALSTLVEETKIIIPKIEQQQKNISPKNVSLPTDQQHKIVLKVAEALGFDFNRGRIDKSVHPFCGGHPNDSRITTRYKEEDATDSVWSTIHEAGHALYEQSLPQNLLSLPCGSAASMGVHESQSRFYENQIGKSMPFCKWIAPEFGISAEELYNSLNSVKKSWIRVDSDEVTYNLHIYLRFELEEKLILGSLGINDLESAWNESFEKLFGLKVETPNLGVLQDTHWYGGAFGYFPTYSLGNLLAAELFDAYKLAHPNWSELVEQGSFAHIKDFMNHKVHALAAFEDSPGTMNQILGGHLPDPQKLLSYFNQKYL